MIKKVHRNLIPTVLNLVCCFIFELACFAPLTCSVNICMGEISRGYIFSLPLIIALLTVFDGVFFMRFKYSIAVGIVGFSKVCWYYVRIITTGMSVNELTLWWFVIFGCLAVWVMLPFFVRKCGNSGLVPISGGDFVWIGCFAIIGVAYITAIIILMSERVPVDYNKDVLWRKFVEAGYFD